MAEVGSRESPQDATSVPDGWRQPISVERQKELQGILDAWNAADANHGNRTGPFTRFSLSGADVSWLAEQCGYGRFGAVHLEGADLIDAHLEGALLNGAHLEGAFLNEAHLEGASLRAAHLDGASLRAAHLDGASLTFAFLAGADLFSVQLAGGSLAKAHLEGAILNEAHLASASLAEAHLEGASLNGAHLEGAFLNGAQLAGADLRMSVLDAATMLNDSTFSDAQHGPVRVADVRWGVANLAVVDWAPLIESKTELGDERAAWAWQPKPFKLPDNLDSKPKSSHQLLRIARADHNAEQADQKLNTFRAAVRANRQLATALRDQGMNEEADAFAYRAQVLQRQVFRQQGKRGRALFSWILDRVAGHGYKPQRSLYTYLGVLAIFTVLYLLAGAGILTFGLPATQFHLQWYEALVLSVASFHGRGFFQPVQSPGDPIAILAAIEAIFGLFIEVAFIATFTQRFFGK